MKHFLCICLSLIMGVNLLAQNITRDYDFKNFNKISISSGFDVQLSQGDMESVSINFDKDLEKYLVVETVNNELKIYLKKRSFFKSFSFHKSQKVKIVVKDLEKINMSGGGNLIIEQLNTDQLITNMTGGGNLLLKANCEDFKCSLSGGGNAVLSGQVNKAKLSLSGGGNLSSKMNINEAVVLLIGGGNANMYLEKSKNLAINLTGGGNAILKGDVEECTSKITGGGDLSAREMKVINCNLAITGGGDAYINVSGKLKLSASSGSSIRCYGNPTSVIKNISKSCDFKIIK